MRIVEPNIDINGQPQRWLSNEIAAGTAGRLVWIYLPNRGRFILSLTPRLDLGFIEAGEIRGGLLTLTNGADRIYSLLRCANLARSHSRWHEPARPTHGLASVPRRQLASDDRVVWVFALHRGTFRRSPRLLPFRRPTVFFLSTFFGSSISSVF